MLVEIPPYGKRHGWVPRCAADYGDGGAYPEIQLAQFPLGLGQTGGNSKVVPLQVDADGKIEWDAILKQGKAKDKLQIWSNPQDLKAKWSSASELMKPDEEVKAANLDRTLAALEEKLGKKMSAGIAQKPTRDVSYIRYTPSATAPGHNPNCTQRVVRMMEVQIDPLEPPKFKHKRIPRGPGTPPPPVNHSPPRKLTAEDQQAWKVPPCVSNWKNQKGYTIPLDKRLAADGRNLQGDQGINDKFAALSESLYIAERKAREEIAIRNDMLKQRKMHEEELREQHLRDVARKAREHRAELTSGALATSKAEAEDIMKRQEIVNDRRREIERDRRMEVAGKKQKRDRNEERDISEKIALGLAQPSAQVAMHDQRLYNQTAGVDTGYGDDDYKYNIYDKPLFADRTQLGIYRHDDRRMQQSLGVVGRVPGKSEFAGADGERAKTARTAPVEFERDTSDVFGLDKLLSEVDSKK